MNIYQLILGVWFALWSYPIVSSIVGALLVYMGIEMDAHRTVVHYLTSLF